MSCYNGQRLLSTYYVPHAALSAFIPITSLLIGSLPNLCGRFSYAHFTEKENEGSIGD